MRLSEKKIDYLCGKIFQEMAKSKVCVLTRAQGPVVEAMKKVILDDLKIEDDLDEEVHRILEEHQEEIRARGADYHTMFKKTKSLLARERKLVL